MSFLDRYGLPLAVGVGGLGALFLLFKHKKPVALANLLNAAPATMPVMAPLSPASLSSPIHPATAAVYQTVNNAQAQVPAPLPPPPPGPAPMQQISDQVAKAHALLSSLQGVENTASRAQIYDAAIKATNLQVQSGDYVYVVAPGDSVGSIAQRFGIPTEQGGSQSALLGAAQSKLGGPRSALRAKVLAGRVDPGDRLILPVLATDAGPRSGASGGISPANADERARP